MNRDIKKFLKLHTALVNEKARIEARLAEIAQVLGDGVEPTAPTVPSKRGGKRTFSEATKAKMRASQQARWAKKKGVAAPADAAVSTPAPKKKRKRTKMSAAGRAAIVAAQKARWAKKKAAAVEAGK